MKDVTLKQRELARLQVLNDILEYQVPTLQAAEILGVSERHTRRLLNAYRRDGAAALAHGNRGRPPHNAVLESEAAAVVRLASTKYAGTNHTHLTELSGTRGHKSEPPDRTAILVKAGIGSPRSRRPQQHRVRRQRMPQEGMLVQVDGSHHRWLGENRPRFALLLTVDDATGTVPAAVFCQEEDTPSYFLLMDKLIRRHGVPLAIYSDRHPVFKFTGDIDRYPAGPTQFARAMEELGVRQIFARSQAKGRVERAAATFQDRLTELRLAGAATITEADELRLPTTIQREVWLRGIVPIVAWSSQCPSIRSCASNTAARCPGTTPSSTAGAPCNCFPARLVLLTPGCKWRSKRTWRVGSWCNTKDGPSLPGGSATPRSAESSRCRPHGRLRSGP